MFSSIILGALFTIIHSSDAGVDDVATSVLIAAAQEKNQQEQHETFEFSSIIITNADCEPISALSAYQKTIRYLNIPVELGLSASRIWTPFPWMWRMDSEAIDELPCLNNVANGWQAPTLEGNLLLADSLRKAEEVKLIATGPLTSVADVFKSHPELMQKVSELHWMGGAIDVPGNLIETPEVPRRLLNEKAEWNVYCDPEAADWIFRNSSFAIYLYPLDISDATYPNDFMALLNEKKETPYSKIIKECYKIVEHVETYRMWDVVAASGVLFPEILSHPAVEKLRVIVSGTDEGAIIRDEAGREVHVYKEFQNNDPAIFYQKVADTLSISTHD